MTEQITGRNGYILTKALVYAIAMIDSLPTERQEVSDRSDMVDLFTAYVPDPEARKYIAASVGFHTGICPDLTPVSKDTFI